MARAAAPGVVVTLAGPGGVGKTRTACQALGAGAWFFDLSAARDGGTAAQRVLHALGTRDAPSSDVDVEEHAARSLADVAPDVVVLDNLEQVEGGGPFVERLRARSPRTSWLVTSRAPLRVAGEVVVHVEPFPGGGDDAADLFLRVLASDAPSELHRDRDRLARLTRTLGGLPLALELAAARAVVVSLDELEAAQPLRVLVDPGRAPDKASSLARSVAWSAELLSPPARRLLAAASVFAGPFELGGLAAVGGADATPEVVDELARLHLWRGDGEGWRPYEVVAQYARDLLDDDARAAAELAHARWCWQRSEPVGHGEIMWSTWEALGPELDLAQRRAERPDAPAELRAVGQRLAVRWHIVSCAQRSAADYVERARRMAPVVHDRLSALITLRRCTAETAPERLAGVGNELEAVVAFADAHGHADVAVVARSHLADHAYRLERFAEATTRAQGALAAARAAGLHDLARDILRGVINAGLAHAGRYDRILAHLREARGDDPPPWLSTVLDVREATTSLEAGDLDAADRALRRLAPPERLQREAALEASMVRARLALLREPAPLATVVANLGPGACPEVRAARLLSAAGDAEEELAACPRGPGRTAGVTRALVEIAAARSGRVPDPDLHPFDPVCEAVSAGMRLLAEQVRGRRSAREAMLALDGVGPPSFELHLVRRVLRDRARVVEVSADGAEVVVGGARVTISSAAGRRVAAALAAHHTAGGPGLSAAALAQAGWPGERITPAAAANRVRVAVAALRAAGLPVAFTRGIGWSLAPEG